MPKCAKHMFDDVAGKCVDCGETWCERCLVPTNGSKSPARCIECSLVAAGVRPRRLRRLTEPTF